MLIYTKCGKKSEGEEKTAMLVSAAEVNSAGIILYSKTTLLGNILPFYVRDKSTNGDYIHRSYCIRVQSEMLIFPAGVVILLNIGTNLGNWKGKKYIYML